ncbi:MAG: hypothetical protein JNJ73_15345 [Hyphomonadaceae bacterium]|nr:hypothetical protein [Hyphomonadaceae bacterium]
MTLTQAAAAWALRGAVLWALLEGALALYDEGARETAMAAALGAHRATMVSLDARARDMRQTLAEETLRLHRFGTFRTAAPGVEPSAAVSQRVQADLFALGAESPALDASVAPIGGGMTLVTLATRWREPRGSTPGVLYGLMAQEPGLAIDTLTFERSEDAEDVEALVRLQTLTAGDAR